MKRSRRYWLVGIVCALGVLDLMAIGFFTFGCMAYKHWDGDGPRDPILYDVVECWAAYWPVYFLAPWILLAIAVAVFLRRWR